MDSVFQQGMQTERPVAETADRTCWFKMLLELLLRSTHGKRVHESLSYQKNSKPDDARSNQYHCSVSSIQAQRDSGFGRRQFCGQVVSKLCEQHFVQLQFLHPGRLVYVGHRLKLCR